MAALDQAGFVQIIRGKSDDPDALRAMMSDTELLHQMRPDIIVRMLAIEPNGNFTETVAFTDETSARRGEQLEMPDDARDQMAAAMHDLSFVDLHHPFFASRATVWLTWERPNAPKRPCIGERRRCTRTHGAAALASPMGGQCVAAAAGRGSPADVAVGVAERHRGGRGRRGLGSCRRCSVMPRMLIGSSS